jgi:hypothetical protein
LTIYRSFHRRLLEPIGNVPPAEFEASYSLQRDNGSPADGSLEGSPSFQRLAFGIDPPKHPDRRHRALVRPKKGGPTTP